MRRIIARAVAALVLAAPLSSICTAPAHAGEENSACVASYERAQVLRRNHKFSRAREELRSCSKIACPALVRNDCITWLDQVQAAFPSIMIRAVKDGSDVAEVKVIEDNEVVATHLDGTSLEVEPGEHTFRFETDGAPAVAMTIVVREREKDRVVPVTFVTPQRAAQTAAESSVDASRPVPAGVWVLGGLGVAGLATFAVLGALGKSDESSLRSSCSPNCSAGSIDRVRSEYVGADVALGVGAAALVASGLWYLLRPGGTEGEAPPEEPQAITVAPARDGAMLQLRGRF